LGRSRTARTLKRREDRRRQVVVPKLLTGYDPSACHLDIADEEPPERDAGLKPWNTAEARDKAAVLAGVSGPRLRNRRTGIVWGSPSKTSVRAIH
jgi:hypothetical protein